jgi:hypothetical protein
MVLSILFSSGTFGDSNLGVVIADLPRETQEARAVAVLNQQLLIRISGLSTNQGCGD